MDLLYNVARGIPDTLESFGDTHNQRRVERDHNDVVTCNRPKTDSGIVNAVLLSDYYR